MTGGTERKIWGQGLRYPAPMSLQSQLWTSYFTFSIEPAIFQYVSPFPSNRHSSRAFSDVVCCVSLRQLLIFFLCILDDLVWCVVVSATYIVLVFFGARCGVWLCLLPISFLCFLCDIVWCVLVSVTYIVLVFFGRRKWFSVLWKLMRSTRIVCGRYILCRGFRTDVGCYRKAVHRTRFFLRTSRAWASFGVT